MTFFIIEHYGSGGCFTKILKYTGARAQTIGFKSTYLDLGKSLSKEMLCKMADTKNNFDYKF